MLAVKLDAKQYSVLVLHILTCECIGQAIAAESSSTRQTDVAIIALF